MILLKLRTQGRKLLILCQTDLYKALFPFGGEGNASINREMSDIPWDFLSNRITSF